MEEAYKDIKLTWKTKQWRHLININLCAVLSLPPPPPPPPPTLLLPPPPKKTEKKKKDWNRKGTKYVIDIWYPIAKSEPFNYTVQCNNISKQKVELLITMKLKHFLTFYHIFLLVLVIVCHLAMRWKTGRKTERQVERQKLLFHFYIVFAESPTLQTVILRLREMGEGGGGHTSWC